MTHRRQFSTGSITGLVALTVGIACTTDSGGPERRTTPDPSLRTDAGPDNEKVDSVRLEVVSTAMEPGETTRVTVEVLPPAVHQVRLAVLDGESGAYLENPSLTTDATGIGNTRLTVVARNHDSITVLAQSGDETAKKQVKLLEPSVADLTVVPLYSGSRAFDSWQIAVLPGSSCSSSYDDSAWDSALTFEREYSDDGSPPTYRQSDVSARHPLTVLVKAESFALGCVSGVMLTPKTDNRVEVPITQRLGDVSRLSFPIEMNVAPESEFWTAFLAPTGETRYLTTLTSAFRDKSDSDLDALLDTMAELASNESLFLESRSANGWDALLTAKLSAEGAQSGLSSRIQRWLQEGATLLQGARAFVGTLAVHELGQRAELKMQSVAGKCPEACGLPVSHLASVTVDAQDILRVGFDLLFLPSPLFTCLADASVASTGDAGASDVLSALAVDFDCSLVADWMSGEDGLLFEGCDTACGASLCGDALAGMWQRVRDSDATESSFEVNAAGKAVLSEDATVTGVDANWVGTTSFVGSETSVSGLLRSTTVGDECQSTMPR